MTLLFLLLIGAFSAFVGFLTGATSIGGVLLVPALVYIADIDIRVAIATAMFGYLFTGAIGAAIFARHGSIEWRAVLWICLGAVPFAFAGAYASGVFSIRLLEAAIAALILFAGWQSLRRKEDVAGSVPQGSLLVGIGSGVGFISAVTGTGGPVTLAPILLWFEVPVLATIGLSQAVMMPIAASATVGNVMLGSLQLELSATVAAGLSIGTLTGARFAHRISIERLKQFLAMTLVVVGFLMIGRLILSGTGFELF